MMYVLSTLLLCIISSTLMFVGTLGCVHFVEVLAQPYSNRVECVLAIVVSAVIALVGIWMVA